MEARGREPWAGGELLSMAGPFFRSQAALASRSARDQGRAATQSSRAISLPIGDGQGIVYRIPSQQHLDLCLEKKWGTQAQGQSGPPIRHLSVRARPQLPGLLRLGTCSRSAQQTSRLQVDMGVLGS